MEENRLGTFDNWIVEESLRFFGTPVGGHLRWLAQKLLDDYEAEVGIFTEESEDFERFNRELIRRYLLVRRRSVYSVSLLGASDRKQERQLLDSFADQLKRAPHSRLGIFSQPLLMLDHTSDPSYREPARRYLLVRDALTVDNSPRELEGFLEQVTFPHELILEQNLKLKVEPLSLPDRLELIVGSGALKTD